MSTSKPDNEGIDFRNNPESRAAEERVAPPVARASEGGAPPRDAPASGELPEDEQGGVASGNPVAGVTISDDDRDDAVRPEH